MMQLVSSSSLFFFVSGPTTSSTFFSRAFFLPDVPLTGAAHQTMRGPGELPAIRGCPAPSSPSQGTRTRPPLGPPPTQLRSAGALLQSLPPSLLKQYFALKMY